MNFAALHEELAPKPPRAYATACPQPAEADMRPSPGEFAAFDPSADIGCALRQWF